MTDRRVTSARDAVQETPPSTAAERIARYDWRRLEADLDRDGHARLPALLDEAQCTELRMLYGERERFRSFIEMGPRRYGEGDYRYFAYPLPPLVRTLRTHLYRRLAPIANRWHAALGGEQAPYPASLQGFVEHCRSAGQSRATPLLLHYETGGFNCMHQDLYGAIAFPLQVVCLLSRPGDDTEATRDRDFGGGAFLSSEHRPRQQTKVEALTLERGEGLIFPGSTRPVAGRRGPMRAQMRHGVSRITWGERYTLGIIFHDAE